MYSETRPGLSYLVIRQVCIQRGRSAQSKQACDQGDRECAQLVHVYGLHRILLNSGISLEKHYNGKIFEFRIIDIVEVMAGFDPLRGIKVQSYYKYSELAMMILKHKGTLPLLESLNRDDAGPETS